MGCMTYMLTITPTAGQVKPRDEWVWSSPGSGAAMESCYLMSREAAAQGDRSCARTHALHDGARRTLSRVAVPPATHSEPQALAVLPEREHCPHKGSAVSPVGVGCAPCSLSAPPAHHLRPSSGPCGHRGVGDVVCVGRWGFVRIGVERGAQKAPFLLRQAWFWVRVIRSLWPSFCRIETVRVLGGFSEQVWTPVLSHGV